MRALVTPCVNICRLDPQSGLCSGCGRTLAEIARWSEIGKAERLALMAEARARLASSHLGRNGTTARLMGFLILIVAAVALGLFLLDPSGYSFADLQNGQMLTMVFYGLFAVMLLAALVPRYRGRLSRALRDAALWVLIFGCFLVIYAYRDMFTPFTSRLMAELEPGSVMTPAPGEAAVVRRRDGTFVVDMNADGVRLPFVFDTGASMVVLRAQDAARLGIDTTRLAYTETVSTANGRTLAAETDIASLSAGTVTLKDVRTLVAKPGALNENLLGQSFLDRLASYGVEGDRLVLRSR